MRLVDKCLRDGEIARIDNTARQWMANHTLVHPEGQRRGQSGAGSLRMYLASRIETDADRSGPAPPSSDVLRPLGLSPAAAGRFLRRSPPGICEDPVIHDMRMAGLSRQAAGATTIDKLNSCIQTCRRRISAGGADPQRERMKVARPVANSQTCRGIPPDSRHLRCITDVPEAEDRRFSPTAPGSTTSTT